MKTVFVLNPKAGKGRGLDKIREEIAAAASRLGVEAGFYVTKGVGDAESFARLACEEAEKQGKELRLIACGGDGTLNEVINGVMAAAASAPVVSAGEGGDSEAAAQTRHAPAAIVRPAAAPLAAPAYVSVGVMPIGTGNDFVRNFTAAGDYMSPQDQLRGGAIKCDLIRYGGLLGGRRQTRYCANMFNVGFDCNVVDMTARVKEYPLVRGSMAYLLSVLAILVKKKGADLRVEIDGETVQDGPVLLSAVAGGCYCGGGVKGLPRASLTDGLLDLSIIYDVSRAEFIKKFPYYAKGTHLELPGVDKIIYYRQGREVRIAPRQGAMRLCVDGEICDAGEVRMEVVPAAIDIVLPGK